MQKNLDMGTPPRRCDLLIGVKFDRETRSLQPDLVIRRVGEDRNLEMSREPIGPLVRPIPNRSQKEDEG